MHPPAVEVLDQLGLLDPLVRAGGVMVDGFAVVLADGKPVVTLPYDEMGQGAGKGFSMEHPSMVACFRREVASDPGVQIRTGVRVAELIREGDAVVGVRTDEGEEIRAPLTVVADGRHSKLRKALEFPERTRLLSYTAAVLVDEATLPRPGHGHVFHGTHGPILAYPIDGGRVRMCIDIPVDTVKGKEAVDAFIRDECAPHVPEPLRGAMLRALSVHETEMCATHSISTRRCTAPGVVLVGDSTGCAHPITAAGMMVALNDIRTLADELGRGDLQGALTRYQSRRYEFVRAREILTEGLYDVFRGGDSGARAMRNGLFRYWTSGPRARAASMKLLSGRESRLRAFIGEYFSVVSESALSVLGGADEARSSAPSRTTAARGLARTAVDQLVRTAELVYNDVRRRTPPNPRLIDKLARGRARAGKRDDQPTATA